MLSSVGDIELGYGVKDMSDEVIGRGAAEPGATRDQAGLALAAILLFAVVPTTPTALPSKALEGAFEEVPKVLVDSVMDCSTRDEDRQDEGGTRLHGTLVALSLVPLAMSAASTAAAQDVSKLDPKGYSGSTHDRDMTQQC